MTQAPKADAVMKAFSDIPALLEAAPALQTRGRFLDCDCRLGPMEQPFFVSIRAGRIVEFTSQPSLMRSWRFSYRATPLAWSEYWRPMPKPYFHDLLALTKRGPGARVTIMEELGHFPFSENPEQFRRDIAPVLAEITKAKASPKQGVHA